MGLDGATNWDVDPALALELLAWQAEMGADEALAEAPLDRFALSAAEAGSRPRPAPPPGGAPAAAQAAPQAAALTTTPAAHALPLATPDQSRAIAEAAPDLPALAAAMEAFDGCELKRGARRFVFADGRPGARVMVVGDAPDADEDRQGRPFVGPAGQLLDRMFAAIGLGREHPDPACALYITNPLPWHPPGNRTPTDDEVALMRPFLLRHIALADPAVLVLMGNTACQAVLEGQGISRRRGQWTQALGRPVLPMYHPSALLQRAELKREAWADLLALQARLRELP